MATLQPRALAPLFTADAVINGAFESISLNDYKGKWTYLLFYPLDFTFVCPTEIIAFNDALPEFQKRNCAVVGISVDSKFVHLAYVNTPRKQGGLGLTALPLVADGNHKIARDYGVLIEDEGQELALRGLFLIDPKGIIRHVTCNDLPVGRDVNEAIRVLEAFQFHEANPDLVCPANWRPGQEPMKADSEGMKEWFQAK